MSGPSAAYRDERVRVVLRDALRPITPSEIASRINEPWCCWAPRAGMSAPISPCLKRIGATKVKRGLWILAAGPTAEGEKK